MTKNRIIKILKKLEVWYPGVSGSEEGDSFSMQDGVLNYYVYNNVLYVHQNDYPIAVYNEGCWKRIYPEWVEETE